MDTTRNGNPRAHATVELTYPDTPAGAHKLLLKSTGNDAVYAAVRLVMINRADGIEPAKIMVWRADGESPVEYSVSRLLFLANSLLFDELGVI